MSDPLGRIKPGPPCPACGYRTSLGALKRVRDELLSKRPSPLHRQTVASGGSGGAGGSGAGSGAGSGSVIYGKGTITPGGAGATGNIGPIQAGKGLVRASGGCGGDGGSSHTRLRDHADALRASVFGIDGEICAGCGTFWKPDARREGSEMREQIRELRLELESAVDILGRVPEPDEA